jgi:four helix bundle protein
MNLAVAVYELSKSFPRNEQFGATSQIRRSAASVPANIAEGYGRGTRQSYLSFLRIARGSLKELETHLELACRTELVSRDRVGDLLSESDELSRMLHGLITRVSKAPE